MAKAMTVAEIMAEPDPGPAPALAPSSPDPAIVALVASALRHALTIAAGAGITTGVYTDNMLTIAAGGAVGMATVLWALYQKIAAAREQHRVAVVSARAGEPVEPLPPKAVKAPPRSFTQADLNIIADRFIAATPPPTATELSDADVERIASRLAMHLHPGP